MILAKKHLAIPGSSVSSECLFSKEGELISAKRNQIKSKNVDTILFVCIAENVTVTLTTN